MALRFYFVLIVLLSWKVCGLECSMNDDGNLEFQQDGEVVQPKPFDCISITKSLETTISVTYTSEDDEGRSICQIASDETPKDKKMFIKSQVPTDMRCKYTCKVSPDYYKCITSTKPNDNACICTARPYRVIIERDLSEGISGQNEGEEGDSCDGKPEGFQFPDFVPCTSVQADVFKRRVDFIPDEEGKCTITTSTKTETRYTESLPNENVPTCLYVCKQRGPLCLGEEEEGECNCASPGLAKRLVPVDDLSLNGVLRTKACAHDSECAPCGKCNSVSGDCELDQEAHTKDICPCGEICPAVDSRTGSRRGRILCIPNVKLECMKKARWLKTANDHFPPGTRYPNFCRGGISDALDTCSCADNYVEVPGPFSAVYCKQKDSM